MHDLFLSPTAHSLLSGGITRIGNAIRMLPFPAILLSEDTLVCGKASFCIVLRGNSHMFCLHRTTFAFHQQLRSVYGVNDTLWWLACIIPRRFSVLMLGGVAGLSPFLNELETGSCLFSVQAY